MWFFLKFHNLVTPRLIEPTFYRRESAKQVIHIVEETCLINSGWLHQDARSLIWRGENSAIKNLSCLWGLQGIDWVLTSNALSVIHNIRLLRPLTFSFQPFKCQVSTLAKALFNWSAQYGVVFSCLDEKGVHLTFIIQTFNSVFMLNSWIFFVMAL